MLLTLKLALLYHASSLSTERAIRLTDTFPHERAVNWTV